MFGSASPAVGQGTVVAGFSSGELNAYRYENGRQVWQDALQRTSIRTSVSSLSDIDADPVIDNGQVFAVGQGGRMVALELITGQRMWELNIAGIVDPVGGGRLGLRGHRRCASCSASRAPNGHIRWINQLPQFAQAEVEEGSDRIFWPGARRRPPDRHRLDGRDHLRRPGDRRVPEPDRPSARRLSLPPVVANSTLYILDDSGRLTRLSASAHCGRSAPRNDAAFG